MTSGSPGMQFGIVARTLLVMLSILILGQRVENQPLKIYLSGNALRKSKLKGKYVSVREKLRTKKYCVMLLRLVVASYHILEFLLSTAGTYTR